MAEKRDDSKNEERDYEKAEVVINERRQRKTLYFYYIDGKPDIIPGETVGRDVEVIDMTNGETILNSVSNRGGFYRRYITAEEAKYYKPIRKPRPPADYANEGKQVKTKE